MPKALERELKKRAEKKNMSEKRENAYVYGTLRKTGWTPSTQKKSSMNEEVSKRVKKA